MGIDQLVVMCNDASHEGQLCKVAQYHRDTTSDVWQRVPPYRGDIDSGEMWREPEPENYTVWLDDDDQPIPESDVLDGQPARLRENLGCKLCSLKASAGPAALNPILTDFHNAGVASIELRWLVRILS